MEMNPRNYENQKQQDNLMTIISLSSDTTSVIDLRMSEIDSIPEVNSNQVHNITEMSNQIGEMQLPNKNQMEYISLLSSYDESNFELKPKLIDYKYIPFMYCGYYINLNNIQNHQEWLSDFNDNINNRKEGKIVKTPLANISSYSYHSQ